MFTALISAGSTAALIGLLIGTWKGLYKLRTKDYVGFVQSLGAALIVGIASGWWFSGMDFTMPQQGCFIVFCSFVAEDILTGAATVGSIFAKDPLGFFTRVWSGIKGKDV